MGGIRAIAVVGALLASVTPAFAQRGVPSNGFPSWQERMLLVYVNRARADPAADLAGCTMCAEKACYSQVRPLDWALGLNRSARFHSANLEYAGVFQHDSPCQLVSTIASDYIPTGTCTGAASCACVGGTFTGTTTWSTRIGMFYASGTVGENIAAGNSTPSSTFYQWLWEPSSTTTCGFTSANGHRYNILDGTYAIMGNGEAFSSSYTYQYAWTQDFSGGTTVTGTLIAGGHEPQYITTSADFRVNYYDTGAPTSATVNVDGTCSTMALERGTATNATYHVQLPLSSATCHKYRFEFVRPGGTTVVLPSTGSYQVGGSSSCADYTATTVNACGTPPDTPPTVATAAKATPSPVTGTTTALSVLGADDGGEPALVYTWSASGPASVTFSANGTNAAKNSTITFTTAGTYTLTATVTDPSNQTATSSVTIDVVSTPTAVAVMPPTAAVVVGSERDFTAMVTDQFGHAAAITPTWSVSGGGTVDAQGRFTAGTVAGGPYILTATGGGATGTAQIAIVDHADTTPPAVTITAPADGSTISGTTTITADATDDVGVATVTFQAGGQTLVASAPPWQVDWDPSALPEGTYAITATATDLAGNASAPSTVTVTFGEPGNPTTGGSKSGGCAAGGDGGLLVLVFAALLRRRATRS